MKKNNILLTSAGRRVSLVNIFKNEVKRFFPEAMVMATDMNPRLSAACQVADRHFSVPRVTDPAYIENLLEICLNNHVGLVIPTIDTELLILSQNAERFSSAGVEIIVSNTGLIMDCRDKRRTAKLFQQIGITTPEIYNRSALRFPCFVKPYDGSCSINTHVLSDQADLTETMLSDDKMMFMELISSDYDEYTTDAYYDRYGQLQCLVPRKRIETRAGEVSKGITEKSKVYEYLMPLLKQIKGAKGCLTVQVFADPDSDRFLALEINPRFGGGYPLAYHAGANYPSWLVQEYFMGRPVEFYDHWEAQLLMLRYDSEVLVSSNA